VICVPLAVLLAEASFVTSLVVEVTVEAATEDPSSFPDVKISATMTPADRTRPTIAIGTINFQGT
jgi:hypothetical protein